MGGGGGGKSKKSKAPPQAAPLDIGAIMGASSKAAADQIRVQYEELIKNYPKLEELSLGTVSKLATNLGNQETQDAQEYIRKALALGDIDPQISEPTSIEQGLYDAGERELALGRSLSPEQIRESQQAARSSMAARGLGASAATTAAEILNRDAYANARERERQAFASTANDQYINNVANRRVALANLYNTGAGNLIAADPYARAVNPGFGLAGTTQGNQMQQMSNTFSSANQLAGMSALANAQMQEGRYNSYMNNQAAMNAARMYSGAANRSGMMGMFGGLGSGLLSGGGAAIGGIAMAGAL